MRPTILVTGIAALFLATGTARAQTEAKTFYVASCLKHSTSVEEGNDCAVMSMNNQGLKGCEVLRKLLFEQDLPVGRCMETEQKAKAELANVRRN